MRWLLSVLAAGWTVIRDSGGDGHYRECRRCGHRVDPPAEQCSSCGSTSIAVYDVG